MCWQAVFCFFLCEQVYMAIGGLFLSTYENKIDTKGRVSIPSSFREIILKENNSSVIIYKSLHKACLEGCTQQHIEKLQTAIDSFNPFSQEKDAFETAIFSDSIFLEIDKDGRINIPKKYTKYANIEGVALFVGKGKIFEIWKPEEYEEYSQKCRSFAIENAHLIKW